MPLGVLSRFSRVQLSATPWTITHQAPLPMGFSRQEHWTGLPCSPPWDLADPGIRPASLMKRETSAPPSGDGRRPTPRDRRRADRSGWAKGGKGACLAGLRPGNARSGSAAPSQVADVFPLREPREWWGKNLND